MEKQYKLFLDNLRDSGVTNMFGAAPYLMTEFPELTRQQAKEVILNWMSNFVTV